MAIVDSSFHKHLTSRNPNRIGWFHAGSSDTEREAAISQYAKSGTDRRRVLEYLVSVGPYGATDAEIAAGTGLYLYTAAPRRKELVDAGIVAASSARRATPRNRRARVWVISPPFEAGA